MNLHNDNFDINKKRNSNSKIKNNFITEDNFMDKNKTSTDKESDNVIIPEKKK